MTNNTTNENTQDELAIAQAAASLAKEGAQALDMTTQTNRAQGREKAVARLATLERTGAVNQGGVLHWIGSHFGPYFSQHRAMSTAVAIMFVTFFAVQQFGLNDNLENSDAYLLAADLPPEAFADKGFNTWLVSGRN
jgi:N-acetylglucosamine-6-phosphate deacetylase